MPQLTSDFAIANGFDRQTASPFDQEKMQHSFLHFPSEIRNAIYSAVIEDHEGVWIISPPTRDTDTLTTVCKGMFGLLLSCKKVQSELAALSVWHNRVRTDPRLGWAFPPGTPEIQHIRSLELYWEWGQHDFLKQVSQWPELVSLKVITPILCLGNFTTALRKEFPKLERLILSKYLVHTRDPVNLEGCEWHPQYGYMSWPSEKARLDFQMEIRRASALQQKILLFMEETDDIQQANVERKRRGVPSVEVDGVYWQPSCFPDPPRGRRMAITSSGYRESWSLRR